MVEADSGDQTAIKLPDGAETFIAKAEKNDLNQFEMTIGEKEMISHDTMRLRFDFDKDLYLGLTPGQHLRIFAPPKEDGGHLTWTWLHVRLESDGVVQFGVTDYQSVPYCAVSRACMQACMQIESSISVSSPALSMTLCRFGRVRGHMSELKTNMTRIDLGTNL